MQQPADMPPFSPPAGAPSPISSRPPAPAPAPAQHHQQQQQHMDEQHGGAAVSGSGSGSVDGGEEGERGGSSSAAGGNRWPRQETLALLKIRSEMDAAFREAALKGPLWEQVSRRLAEMGHTRSAKKCREKFENVDKYYRRTKDGRTGRGDGKTYRFFTELEALHGAHHPPPAHVPVAPPAAPAASTIAAYSAVPSAPRVLQAEPSPPPLLLTHQPVPAEAAACRTTTTTPMGDASFSHDSDGEDTDETADGGKRKRRGGSGSWGHGGKAMRFFEGLMRQVMERQEAMQSRLLEAIERRDQDRMIREEAWRRQEVARLAREQDALAQERAVAASRDAAVVSFIQRITGQIVPVHAPPSSFPAKPAATVTSVKPPPLQPTPVASAAPAPPTPRPPVQAQPNVTTPMRTQPQTPPPQPQPHATPTATEPQPQTPQPQHQQSKEIVVHAPEQPPVDMAGGASPSRWPKAEVHALIQLRTEMETRYQDTAPKGPLWEDISVGMRRLGYNRSSKRCKEKWENINKYFKKVKESSRKRPEDSKTCPYFHQLDALYRTKALASSSGVHAPALAPSPFPARAEAAPVTVLSPVPLSSQTPPPAAQRVEHGAKNVIINGNGHGNGAAMQVKASNGAGAAAMFPSPVHAAGNGGNNGTATNKVESKPEGIAKETAPVQPAVAMNHSYGRNDRRDVYDLDSDSMDEDEEDDFDDDDEEEDQDGVPGGCNINMPPAQYDAQFLQRQHQQQQQQNHNHGNNHNVVRPNAVNGSGNPPAGNATPSSAPATSGTPFLAMVQ
ncbi:trihelix transcription factor GTL1-like [Triticum dicoccoides]|uniref:trihelix transcription factor GTL1-like n=1 Tax=Triticum dicoccoides TaxID=85692 RepID=UPI00188FA22E|nr:trihelix transcription factor GTL1-like [Triticum dicoccoides]